MKKILDQQEIDSILSRARNNPDITDRADDRIVEKCNFRAAGQMSQTSTRFLLSVYEGFARSVSNSLGAYLRAQFQMVLSFVEQMPVRDFFSGFQETGFIATLALQPDLPAALMQIEATLVFPIIDVLLGGSGVPAPKPREMTEIDQDIMEGVAQIICRQLETIWQSPGFEIRLAPQPNAAQIQSIYAPTEKLTTLTFEIKLNGTTGTLKLSFPAALMSAILQDISDPRRQDHSGSAAGSGLRERVLDCSFSTTLGVRNLRIPLRELVAMKEGSILDLRRPIKAPASLLLGGRDYFEAAPVRSGKQRAAQLVKQIAPS